MIQVSSASTPPQLPRAVRRRQLELGFLITWLLVIGWCTLRPAPDQVAEVAGLRWYCIACGEAGVADVLLNILLFIPLGFLLHQRGWSIRRTATAVIVLSSGIELIQAALLVGRDASLGDVLSNSTGGIVGWFSVQGVAALARPTMALARRGVIAVLLLMSAIWMATGAGLQPSLTDLPWIGQPMHEGRGEQPFPGVLQQATMNGIRIPNELMPAKPMWRDSLVLDVDATRSSAERFAKTIIMLRIVDTAHIVQAVIDQLGDDARLRIRVRSSDWMLHNPRWRVAHAMRMTPGEPWRFRWRWLGNRFTIESGSVTKGPATVIDVPLSIGLGWAFVHPFVSVVSETRSLWTALWLGIWFALLGWFAGRLSLPGTGATGIIAIGIFIAASRWWQFSVLPGEIGVAVAVYAATALLSLRRVRHE